MLLLDDLFIVIFQLVEPVECQCGKLFDFCLRWRVSLDDRKWSSRREFSNVFTVEKAPLVKSCRDLAHVTPMVFDQLCRSPRAVNPEVARSISSHSQIY